MSDRDQEIVASLRRTYEAFSRGDFDTAVEVAHPEIEFVPPGGQSSLRGADAVRAWMEPDAFEEQHIEPLEFSVQGNRSWCANTPGPEEPGAASSWIWRSGRSGR